MRRARYVTAIRLTACVVLAAGLSARAEGGPASSSIDCDPTGPPGPFAQSPGGPASGSNPIIGTLSPVYQWSLIPPQYSEYGFQFALYTGGVTLVRQRVGGYTFVGPTLEYGKSYVWTIARLYPCNGNLFPTGGSSLQFRTAHRAVSVSGDPAFGDVPVGTSATRVLMIHNTGWSPLTVDSLSYPDGFNGTFAGTVPAGGSRVVPVRFTPGATTSYGGTAEINGNQTSGTNTFMISGTGIPSPHPPPRSDARRAGDFDGDGKTDVAVFRASTGQWHVLQSSTGNTTSASYAWGLSTDTPMPGDYDGDGKTDPAVFRLSTGSWYVLKSSTNYGTSFGVSWGLSTDVPVPGDYDGDGKTDPAIYRPSTGLWAMLKSSNGYTSASYVFWGLSTDLPIQGDYDGDTKTDPAVFRPSTGGWYVLKSSTNYGSSFGVSWGLSTDTLVPGDYDGDGKVDPAVFRPSTGGWYMLQSKTHYMTYTGLIWGSSGDIPVPGDFDGDGTTDPAFFHPPSGEWSILKSDVTAAHRWRFDEASGDVALDSAVAGFMDGVLGPGAHRAVGSVGPGALQFDANDADGYVSAPAEAAGLGTGDFTISFWLRRTPGAGLTELVGNRGAEPSHGNFVDFYADGDDIGFEIDENASARGYIFLLSSGAGVDDGVWHKITGVRAGPAAWLYIDGVLAASGTAIDGVTANIATGYDVTVGVNDQARVNGWLFCGCSFDDVRIYTRAVSASEIQLDYSAFTVSWGLPSDTPINKRP